MLHTTEGSSYAGARSVYHASGVPPHFTVSYEAGYFQCWQHLDTKWAAHALRDTGGGIHTDRGGAIQIECVGTCDWANRHWSSYVGNWARGYKDGLKRLMRWIEQEHGIRRTAPLIWKVYPDSYGNNGVRMSYTQWVSFNGWCGHQHVPENTHGDPGLIDISYLLNEDGDLSYASWSAEDKAALKGDVESVVFELLRRAMQPLLSGNTNSQFNASTIPDWNASVHGLNDLFTRIETLDKQTLYRLLKGPNARYNDAVDPVNEPADDIPLLKARLDELLARHAPETPPEVPS